MHLGKITHEIEVVAGDLGKIAEVAERIYATVPGAASVLPLIGNLSQVRARLAAVQHILSEGEHILGKAERAVASITSHGATTATGNITPGDSAS